MYAEQIMQAELVNAQGRPWELPVVQTGALAMAQTKFLSSWQ